MVTPAFIPPQESRFKEQFEALTGHGAFPWQESLFSLVISGRIPSTISLPTGIGKTSIMAIWLLALAEQADRVRDPQAMTLPRRLIWVVNRRVVVDQSTEEAERLRKQLKDSSITELDPVRNALRELKSPGSDDLLGVSTLRGQFADNGEWRSDPARPAVIVGTVDMVGSRLLFSGYGAGFKVKPLLAGFLGQGSLLVHDEAHLEPAFQKLLTSIREEQERSNEFGKFHIIELSATTRKGTGLFGLTTEEKFSPADIPDPPREPIHVVWRRLSAKKTIHLVDESDKNLADQIAELAYERFKDTDASVLIFLRRVDDVERVFGRLQKLKQRVQQLTGTLRGFERDKIVTEDLIFRRFLQKVEPDGQPVYLVCTSAGEVGINISADRLVCDLSTFESMVQRFGRVNRFGNAKNTEIHILRPSQFKEDELDQRRKKTLALLERLKSDASPKSVGELPVDECVAAFAPAPAVLSTSEILFDSWSLTTIRGKLPGRPHVEPYLHGLSSELPETYVAWRDEVGIVTGDLLEQYPAEGLLDDYPLKPHELLRDRSDRVFKNLASLAERQPEAPVWLLDEDDGSVEVSTIGELTQKGRKERIHYRTVVLTPTLGGLRCGLLNADSDTAGDIADEWKDEYDHRRRVRIWEDDPEFAEKTKGLRLIRTLDITLEENESDGRSRHWHWYELPKSAETDGSKTGSKTVEWQVHTDDVVNNVEQIVRRLPLPDEIQEAVTVAAKFHDLGKKRPLFQRILGNTTGILLAKSGKKKQPCSVNENYRHEFGSLLDIQGESKFKNLSDEMKELVLHLIATHHGRARPHFPADEAFDPEPKGQDISIVAAQVPQRFAHLQRKYGRWGLAYLESLLRAADYAASANPSMVVDDHQ